MHMIGIRTRELRKVYNSAPPFASSGGSAPPAKRSQQPKPEIIALDGLTLEIAPGEVFGLLGPNGAGKSTTVGILTTRVRPTAGQAWIGDHEVWTNQVAVKRLQAHIAELAVRCEPLAPDAGLEVVSVPPQQRFD